MVCGGGGLYLVKQGADVSKLYVILQQLGVNKGWLHFLNMCLSQHSKESWSASQLGSFPLHLCSKVTLYCTFI